MLVIGGGVSSLMGQGTNCGGRLAVAGRAAPALGFA